MVQDKKPTNGLKMTLVTLLCLGTFGSVLGLESNIQSFNKTRIKDTSFKSYLEESKKHFGEGAGSYAVALWTYPGARLGVAIHNYRLPKNS
jgi:hypothetical protein